MSTNILGEIRAEYCLYGGIIFDAVVLSSIAFILRKLRQIDKKVIKNKEENDTNTSRFMEYLKRLDESLEKREETIAKLLKRQK